MGTPAEVRIETMTESDLRAVAAMDSSTRMGEAQLRDELARSWSHVWVARDERDEEEGVDGVVGFLVAQQTREIGVRMALGATPQGILKMVLSSVARWTLGGAVVGILGAWFCTRLLESLLFEVKTHDPVLLGGAVALLLAAAFLAAWIPARRAMRVDPMVALRYE